MEDEDMKFKFEVGDLVKITNIGDDTFKVLKSFIGNEAVITSKRFNKNGLKVYALKDSGIEFFEDELELIKSSEELSNKLGYFGEKSLKVGNLVDEKQKAYGNSVDKAFKLMKVYLENYKNEDGTYTIPESLLQHILLQVRIIDKQNRIFNNPDGDLMQENPYMDTVGYGLLGMRMCEQNSK
jgi:hypothetical protein